MRRFRPRVTYANVTATLALFIALGGSGYAALKLPRNSVGTSQLKKESVSVSKIRPGAVTSFRVRDDSLTGGDIDESKLGKVPRAADADRAAAADHATAADNASRLGGVTAGDLKVRCPGGTTAYAGACFEVAERAAGNWDAANEQCASGGRRLPSAGELEAFTKVTRIDFAGYEWSSSPSVDSVDFWGVDDGGVVNSFRGSEGHGYRCVALPTN
jgi:hypothetical protein